MFHSFNCAAPFRERLAGKGISSAATYAVLQLCRPLSGAVRTRLIRRRPAVLVLQLCRPLSGAVSCQPGWVSSPSVPLQLCRPLSGAVRVFLAVGNPVCGWASIVPPPFGSG